MDQEILKKRNLVATNETFGNIAILNKGKKTLTAQFLTSFSHHPYKKTLKKEVFFRTNPKITGNKIWKS